MAAYIGVFTKTLAVLLTLLVISRILGRRTLSELTFHDFVITLVLGNLGASAISDEEFGLAKGIVVIIVAALWVLGIDILTLKFTPARKIIEAEPLLVISKGYILENNLKKRFYNVNDLLEMLREQGTFDPGQVEVGLIEADGHLSILKKPEYQTPTTKDVNPDAQNVAPLSNLAGKELIIDGRIMLQNLSASGITPEQLKTRLSDMGITATEDVMLAMITPEGKLYVDRRNDNAAK